MATYYAAREKFDYARSAADDQAIAAIAEGLHALSRAVESDINKLERELQTIKNRVNSIR